MLLKVNLMKNPPSLTVLIRFNGNSEFGSGLIFLGHPMWSTAFLLAVYC